MRPKRLSLSSKIVLLTTFFSTVPAIIAICVFIHLDPLRFWLALGVLIAFSMITLAAAIAFARHLTEPIRALMRAAEHVAKGDFTAEVNVATHDELQDLAVTFNRMSYDIQRYSAIHVDELVAEKAKTEGIIYSSEDGILLTDPQGQVQLINPKAQAILALDEVTREDLTGRPIWSFVKDDRLAVALRETIQGDSPKAIREINLSAEGVRRFFSLTVFLVNAPEGSASAHWIVVILRNITAEKELDQLKDDFLASLTHDLRSPMTAIRGYLQVLAEEMAGPINPEQKKMLHIMENASTKLLHIVSNLLDTAKMSAGKLKVNLADCNLRQLVPNTVELFHTEAAKKKITLTLDMPEEMAPIRVDPSLMERVLINLIGNAIKFTPDGGFVTVKFIDLNDRIQGQVTDTGAGLASEFMGRVFKKFEQASGTRGGTGLGLAICKFIVEAHYGEINVRSKVGEGTTFTFTIPRGLEQNEKGDIFRIRETPPLKAAANG